MVFYELFLLFCYMSVKERIREFVKYKGMSERAFCLSIGVSTSFVNSMRKSLQPDKISSIVLHYPELNPTWLITGDGQMILGTEAKTSKNTQSPAYPQVNLNDELGMMKQLLESKDKLVASLEREIQTLNRQIEGKEKESEAFVREIQTLRDLVASYQQQLNTPEQHSKAV
jgi:hypothetical protein